MDTTTTVAIAGIAGTLTGALLGPVVSSWAQRRTLRADRLLERRLTSYVDLLATLEHVHSNIQTWSTYPLAELEEPALDHLRDLAAQVRVFASKHVRDRTDHTLELSARFYRALFGARQVHERDRGKKRADSAEAIKARLGLGAIADELTKAVKELESAIRRELGTESN